VRGGGSLLGWLLHEERCRGAGTEHADGPAAVEDDGDVAAQLRDGDDAGAAAAQRRGEVHVDLPPSGGRAGAPLPDPGDDAADEAGDDEGPLGEWCALHRDEADRSPGADPERSEEQPGAAVEGEQRDQARCGSEADGS
jgi:hypothetical protein